MCGFSVYIGGDLDKESCKNLSDKVGYRGPDSKSFFESEKILMAFHRLEIIGGGKSGSPVSYTHLTLPTNREV